MFMNIELSRPDLSNFLLSDTQYEKVICKGCNKLFKNYNSWRVHYKNVCSDGGNGVELKCDFCNASFERKYGLRRHLSRVHSFKSIVLQYLRDHTMMLRELVATNRRVNKSSVCPMDTPKFPIQTLEEFLEFDSKIAQDDSLSEYMIMKLSSIGGSGVENLTRRIMQFLLSNEVAILYNWKGREKMAFEKTAIMNVIYEAAKLNFPVGEKNDLLVANAVKVWLKFAKSRIINSKKKLIKPF